MSAFMTLFTYLRYIVYVLLIVVVVSLVISPTYTNKPHLFWQNQPVSWDDISGDEMVPMHSLPYYDLHIPPSTEFRIFDVSTGDDMEPICDFLNANFSSYLRMQRAVVKSHLRKDGCANIGFYKENQLIGFIHGRPINIVYKDAEYTVHYVEYLCVKKEYRGQNISPLLISRYVQEMERKLARSDMWFLFKKDGTPHPFRPFIESQYRYMELQDISSSIINSVESPVTNILPVTDTDVKTAIYNEWILYSSKFLFRRSAIESELFSTGTHLWICGIDKVAIIAKFTELYEPEHSRYVPVVDIEYIVELSDKYTESHPWSFYELLSQWKYQNYGYVTVNDIGEHMQLLERLMSDNVNGTNKIVEWKTANPFQYYAFNFKCPLLQKKDVYFTIN
jgi:hypothetical protein